MAEPAIDGVTPDVLAILFAGVEPGDDVLWRGEIYRLDDGRELLPFVFMGIRFFAIFSAPLLEAGGDEALLAAHSREWAAGFVAHPHSRLVKFCRAEADQRTTLFQPGDWKLGHGGQVFAFSELLAEVMVQHADSIPTTQQYFYWPADERVERLYQRIFRRHVCRLLPGAFRPILNEIGVFHGYERTRH